MSSSSKAGRLSGWILVLGLFFLTLALLLESCGPNGAVASFAAAAQKTEDAGATFFADIHGSCVRRHVAMAPLSPAFFPAALRVESAGKTSEIPQCASFAPQGEALTKASAVLSAYFRAMQQLASFNSSSVSGAAGQAGFNIGVASGLNSAQIDSISKLASLLTQVFTQRYQQHDLVKMLSQADPSIQAVTQGMEEIVAKDYEGLLREEQESLPAQYQAVVDVKNPATVLLLNRAFSSDLRELEQRKAAADAYAKALKQIREGHHALTTMAKSGKPKNPALALQPYTDQMEALLPILGKHS